MEIQEEISRDLPESIQILGIPETGASLTRAREHDPHFFWKSHLDSSSISSNSSFLLEILLGLCLYFK
jgi:hypothetical protein